MSWPVRGRNPSVMLSSNVGYTSFNVARISASSQRAFNPLRASDGHDTVDRSSMMVPNSY
jgi:hypothetical protein